MGFSFRHRAAAAIAGALETLFRCPFPLRPSAWARRFLIVPDGPRKLDLWDGDLTPYIDEPLNKLGPDDPTNEIAVMKSAQTGFTTLLLAAIGHSIDQSPCDMMVIQPTDGALTDFNNGKLNIVIEKSEALQKKVAGQTARSGKGSTTYEKVFGPAGEFRLYLGISNSAADLRSKTIKRAYCDEVDQYPDDLDDQGAPLAMVEARQESFLESGDWKRLYISTPKIKGDSEIERRYKAGDQRRWHVRCPACDDGEFVFEHGPYFRFNPGYPYEAHYVAPCCGSIIHAHEKNALSRKGRWIATAPRPGAYPSYHFDGFSSPFVPWDIIAKRLVEAGTDPIKLKGVHNLTLGLPFEVAGDAPDHVSLLNRREGAAGDRLKVPARGLLLTGSADVQMRGIWYEILAVAPNRETWVVDAGYIAGDTADPDSGAFAKLRQHTIDRAFADAFGRQRHLDAFAIDSGFRAHVVYAWVRNVQRMHPDSGKDVILAVKGMEGWSRPAIGLPTLVDIDLAGTKIKQGARVWGIGTWSLKGAFYEDLRKEGRKAGFERDPDGYCHFGVWLDEVYFRQITSEYLAEERIKGRILKRWKLQAAEKDNHLLDCRVYNLALAEYLGVSSMTPDEWAALARARGLPDELTAPSLFAPQRRAPEAEGSSGTHEPAPQAVEPDAPAPADDWIGRDTANWF